MSNAVAIGLLLLMVFGLAALSGTEQFADSDPPQDRPQGHKPPIMMADGSVGIQGLEQNPRTLPAFHGHLYGLNLPVPSPAPATIPATSLGGSAVGPAMASGPALGPAMGPALGPASGPASASGH